MRPAHGGSSDANRPRGDGIRAVTFDVGGTLIECWPSVGHLYAQVAARHGSSGLSASLLNRNFQTAWRELKNFGHTAAEWSVLVDETFCGLVKAPPSQTFFNELYDRFSQPDAWRIFEDVVPTLEQLKSRGLKLGIISNWDERLRPLLRRLELDGFFEVIIVSGELGAHKPNPRCFHAACSALGVSPGETLHVGDSPAMDVEGARAAGLRAWCLQRAEVRPEPPLISSLRELDKI